MNWPSDHGGGKSPTSMTAWGIFHGCPPNGLTRPLRAVYLWGYHFIGKDANGRCGPFLARILSEKGRFTMKQTVVTGIGVIGGFIASLFGGWDAALVTLMIFMGVDYITGLIVAGVFGNSEKTANGGLESRAGWKGLCRKGMTLLVVLVAYPAFHKS